MRHLYLSAAMIALVGLLTQGCGAPANHGQGSSTKSLKDSVVTDTTNCQTAEAIRNHIGTVPTAQLVGTDGKTVANINDRFCVHTVVDGTKRLVDDMPAMNGLSDAPMVAKGLLVAISDVGHGESWNNPYSDGATFKQAQKACSALTLFGKTWTVPASMNDYATPHETESGRSIEALGPYFFDPMLGNKNFANGEWWSGSSYSDSGLSAYAWHFGGYTSYVFHYDWNYKFAVRCVARL